MTTQHRHDPHQPSSRSSRTVRRLLLPSATAVVLVAATALPAVAHVRVSSPDAAPGGFGKLVFRVPTESDTASTTKLTVDLPRDTPFAFVSSRPVPGWKVTTTERKLAKPIKAEGFTLTKTVASVTWTAGTGAGIKPGEFDEFELSVGPFPKSAPTVSLPAVQTYSDGTVVRWDDPTQEGKPEPEHPAPTLDLAAQPSASASPAAASTPSPTASASDSAEPAPTTQAASDDAQEADTLGRWLGGAGLVLGAVALVVALTRGRGGARSR